MSKYSNELAVLVVAMMSTLITGTAQADTLYGLYADVNYLQYDANLTVNNNGNQIERDMDSDKSIMASVSVEHGVPLVPNVRMEYTQLTAGVDDFTLDSQMTDIVAYYEFLDNVISFDAGVGIKKLSMQQTTSLPDTEDTELEETLPLAYASVGFSIPLTPFSAKAEANIAQKDEIETRDIQAEVKYKVVDNIAFDIGAKAGYRLSEITMSSGNLETTNQFKGPYVGAEVHF